MKVLYVSKALIVAAYRNKIAELGRSIDVTAVIPERWGNDPVERSADGAPDPVRVPVRLSGHNHLHFYPNAGRWLDAVDPDLVHIDEEAYSLVTLQLARLCVRRGTPFLFFGWQNLDRRLPPPFARVRSFVFRRAAGALAGTGGAADVLRRAGYAGPLAIVPQFGVDPDAFVPDAVARSLARKQFDIPEHAFVVGYGGRLIAEKGIHELVDAFARMRPTESASYLLVIGDGAEMPALRERGMQRRVADRLRFAGRVPSSEMPAILPAMDLLVLPTTGTRTWTEQFGRILVEAMACGVAVAGSRCGEIPSVIGDVGALFPPGDIDAMTAVLETHRDDSILRTTSAAAGRQRVLEHFTQRSVADRTAAFYTSLLEHRGAAA